MADVAFYIGLLIFIVLVVLGGFYIAEHVTVTLAIH